MNDSGAIIIDSSNEKNSELIRKWSRVYELSNSAMKTASSGFLITLLSPLDFEGPVAEILTAAIAAVGFSMKKVSEAKLEKLGAGRVEFTSDDKEGLGAVVDNVSVIRRGSKHK